MIRVFLPIISLLVAISSLSQRPCASPNYRKFDFWIGEWEVFNVNGRKAGDSKITLILDSCIILEEWTSANTVSGLRYAGKSFNTFNAASGQWQQTWVDNVGGSTAYLKGQFADNKIIFKTDPFPFTRDTIAIRRLTFYDLGKDKVRQHGEISKNNEGTWATEYDLEYRRRK
jgi:hypothetical protein